MRPVMVSPCNGCGGTLEHDHDPRTVLCAGCDRDRFAALELTPPPTTEWHGKPPPPPPMRSPYQSVPTWLEHGYRVLFIAAVLGLGFLLGWIARGGV